MRKLICLVGFSLLFTHMLTAQDEGVITKRDRIERDKGIFIGIGPSFTLSKNIGDYSTGFNIEAGFQKRLNRVFTIGPSISFLSFKYDPEKTKAKEASDLYTGTATEINDWHAKYDQYGLPPNYTWQYGYLLNLDGGDITLISLGVNLKLNFIPITDKSKFSFYGFAKPFVAYSKRGAVTGTGERYVYESYEDFGTSTSTADDILYYGQEDDTWHADGEIDKWGPSTTFEALYEETKITGGIFLGPGVEFMPAGKVTIYAQAAFGYTFPISYVSTESYTKTIASYNNVEFPIVEKGFPSINLQFGACFNF